MWQVAKVTNATVNHTYHAQTHVLIPIRTHYLSLRPPLQTDSEQINELGLGKPGVKLYTPPLLPKHLHGLLLNSQISFFSLTHRSSNISLHPITVCIICRHLFLCPSTPNLDPSVCR